METLDKVIKTLEDAIDTTDAECPMMTLFEGDATDALHYLKEYQRDKDELDSTRLAYLDILTDYVALKNFWAEQQANPPLTWDELKQMEGKPVWIELLRNGHWKGWDVIAGFDEDDFGVAMVTVHNDDYYKADLGTKWQAYRKERK